MSFTPGFAPDARSQWQSLSFDLQEIVLDEVERVASHPPPDGEYVLDPVLEEADVRHYVFVRVIVDGGRGTVTVVGVGTIRERNDDDPLTFFLFSGWRNVMRTIAKPNAKRTPRGSHAARELMDGVRKALRAASTGDYSTLTVREVEIADPAAYGPGEVSSLRQSLGVSQALFAQLVGVSPRLVAHWEYGIRTPAPLARRLLDKIKEDPDGYMKSLIKRREVAVA